MNNELTLQKLNHLIGKRHEALEEFIGLNWWIETMDRSNLGYDIDHNLLVQAYLELQGNTSVILVKLYNGEIQEFFEMDPNKIKQNLFLLGEEKGDFNDDSDDDFATTYACVSTTFIAQFCPGIVFFSGNEETIQKFAHILDKHNIQYHAPYEPKKFRVKVHKRKLGRNEPCHCYSGKKYKKCCMNKDLKETGKMFRTGLQ